MGCGVASGENRAIEAAQKAISSPLLEGVSIKGAKNILLNVTGSSSLTMEEIEEGNNVIYEAAGEEANVIFGWVNKEEMNEYVSYTVIATGFENSAKKPQPQKPTSNFFTQQYTRNDINNFASAKTENLDTPTFIRQTGKQNMFENGNIPQGNLQFDKYNPVKNLEDKNPNSFNDSDDDDSSSFLKMMMD